MTQVHLNQLKFKCDTCKKSFVSKGILRLHQSVHSGDTFVNHLKAEHEDGAEKYKCNICDKFFINASRQKKHVRVVHKKIKI